MFCGEAEPDDPHIVAHSPSACQEGVFNRKDHPRQHIRLVHEASLLDWSTKSWVTFAPEVRSHYGFCGITLESWPDRVEHLAQHFKMTSAMVDWTGDWGFDSAILGTIENSIPPCEKRLLLLIVCLC